MFSSFVSCQQVWLMLNIETQHRALCSEIACGWVGILSLKGAVYIFVQLSNRLSNEYCPDRTLCNQALSFPQILSNNSVFSRDFSLVIYLKCAKFYPAFTVKPASLPCAHGHSYLQHYLPDCNSLSTI